MLGIEPGVSVRETRVLNHWAISLGPKFLFGMFPSIISSKTLRLGDNNEKYIGVGGPSVFLLLSLVK